LLPFNRTSSESLMILTMFHWCCLRFWKSALWQISGSHERKASWTAPVRASSLPSSSLEVDSPSLLLACALWTSRIHVSNPAAWRCMMRQGTCASSTTRPGPKPPF
jgi:hypothetical protein